MAAPCNTVSASTSASTPRRADPTPCQAGQEAGQGVGLDRLDLPAQRRDRAAPQLAQHVVVAPLPLHAVGAELAPHDPILELQRLQRASSPLDRHAEAPGGGGGEERPVGAGIAGDQ